LQIGGARQRAQKRERYSGSSLVKLTLHLSCGVPQLQGGEGVLLVSLSYLFIDRDLSKVFILNFVHLVVIASR